MTGITAKVIADSITESGCRLITLQLRYPRFIHSEVLTHRMFSRSASSSRAIPVMKMLKQIWNDPAMPVQWGENKPGMQASTQAQGFKLFANKFLWKTASKFAVLFSYLMHKCNLHKQIANRITEPWQFISVILTSTEWDNFFELREHPDAQPEFQVLANEIHCAIDLSTPVLLKVGEWHLPYVSEEEKIHYHLIALKQISTARSARVSYLTHDGKKPSIDKDISLHNMLVGSKPLHASPSEHVATPSGDKEFHKNFRGWKQYREEIEANIYHSRVTVTSTDAQWATAGKGQWAAGTTITTREE